jgi:hypothetical protein
LADQIIPFTNDPNQTLTVSLSIDNGVKTLKLAAHFNEIAGYWVMDISDQFSNPLVFSIPLVTGYAPAANLLAAHGSLGIGSAYVVNASGTTAMDYPDQTNLGTDFLVIWSDTAK